MFRKLLVGTALTAFAYAQSAQSDLKRKENELQAAEAAFAKKDLETKEARDTLKDAENVRDLKIEALNTRFNELNVADLIYKNSLGREVGCSETNESIAAMTIDAAAKAEKVRFLAEECAAFMTNKKNAQMAEESAKAARYVQEAVVRKAKENLDARVAEKESAQLRLARAESAKDDDLEFANIMDGSEGIPGGTGSFDFDMSDFELDSVGSSRSPEQIEAQRAKELAKTKSRITQIRGWYAKQRQAALKGVYSPKRMREVRAAHSQRIKVARSKIENYKRAVELRYVEYKKLYDNRSINSDQYKNVGNWRRENIRKAKDKFNAFRDKVKKNWTTISNRNETRQDKRRERLETAREAALKQIEAVKREYRKKDDKLQIALKRPQDSTYEDDIFGTQLFGGN